MIDSNVDSRRRIIKIAKKVCAEAFVKWRRHSDGHWMRHEHQPQTTTPTSKQGEKHRQQKMKTFREWVEGRNANLSFLRDYRRGDGESIH